MKRILWCIIGLTLGLTLWLCGQGFTFNDVVGVGQKVSASAPAGCETESTTIPHDVFLEGFETATYGLNDTNNWTTNWAGTTENIDLYFDISSYTTGKPDYSCDHGLKVTVPNSTGTYVSWDRGSTLDLDAAGADVVFYFYVETITLSDTETHSIAQIRSNDAVIATLNIINNGGTFQTRIAATVSSAWLDMPQDTWNKVHVHLDATRENSYLNLNDSYSTTNVFTRVSNEDLQVLYIGAPSGVDSSDGGAVLFFDLICIEAL